MSDVAKPLLSVLGTVLIVVGIGLLFAPRRVPVPPRTVRSPVTGRWRALNSPATKVPSHGTHGYGQTFAIDVVHEPEPGARPEFGVGPAVRSPAEYPAFGQPVVAPGPGCVVRVRDGARDHRSRSAVRVLPLFYVEGFFRELGGVGRVLGNHVVVEQDDGAFALVAHLRRHSARVREGQRVSGGDLLALCGNTGNSTEPHVHFQLMDHPRPTAAVGLPFVFSGMGMDDGLPGDGVPANDQLFQAGARS